MPINHTDLGVGPTTNPSPVSPTGEKPKPFETEPIFGNSTTHHAEKKPSPCPLPLGRGANGHADQSRRSGSRSSPPFTHTPVLDTKFKLVTR